MRLLRLSMWLYPLINVPFAVLNFVRYSQSHRPFSLFAAIVSCAAFAFCLGLAIHSEREHRRHVAWMKERGWL